MAPSNRKEFVLPKSITDSYKIVKYRAPRKAAPKTKQPQYTARVLTLAIDPTTIDTTSTTASAREARILARIEKCLSRGRHPNTPEAEARSSIRMASKLMKEHNITQAEMDFASTTTASSTSSRFTAGESIVEVVHIAGKRVNKLAFASILCNAMALFFDCKSGERTNVDHYRNEYVFWGVATNTKAAAMAFEMCFNLIEAWAVEKTKGVVEKRSYSMGVANGLFELADEGKKAEKREVKEVGNQLVLWDFGKIADEYLKGMGMKATRGKKSSPVKDFKAFDDGQKDSKAINVKGKRLRSGGDFGE